MDAAAGRASEDSTAHRRRARAWRRGLLAVSLWGALVGSPWAAPPDDPPSVTLLSPGDGTPFVQGTAVVFSASATDDVGVSRVDFLFDGVTVASDPGAPYSAVVRVPTGVSTVEVSARAVDTLGQQTTSAPITLPLAPDVAPPSVSLTSPSDGQSFIAGLPITASANASDDVGVDRVEFLLDGTVFATDPTPPYTASLQAPDVGSPTPFEIRARAFDISQQSTDDPVTVSVIPDLPPSVLLTSPPDGAQISTALVDVAADAVDDVAVDRVELLFDGSIAATIPSPPYRHSRCPLPGGAATVEVQARAVDSAGQQTTTAPTTIVNLDPEGSPDDVRIYEYTGALFEVVIPGRFTELDSVTGHFTLDCSLIPGGTACRSLPYADYAAAVTSFSFTASGSPDLTIDDANARPARVVEFATDANGDLSGAYTIAYESSAEGGDGVGIVLMETGGFTYARNGASGGVGRVDYGPGLWVSCGNFVASVPALSVWAQGGVLLLLLLVGARVAVAGRM